jgi:protein SCO1/2
MTRYLYEMGYTGNTLKMAIIEAGEGRVGSSMDMIALWCAHYDPLENRYSADARRLLSFAAGAFVLVGLAGLLPFWLTRQSKRKHSEVLAAGESIRQQTSEPSPSSIQVHN